MEDINLRLEFHRALDAIATPTPWLADRIRKELRRRPTVTPSPRAWSWLEPTLSPRAKQGIAATLAVTIAVAAVGLSLAVYRYAHRTIPVTPPVPAPASGSGFRYLGSDVPYMVSESTGWMVDYPSSLKRTTDGGANWSLVPGQEVMDFRNAGWHHYAIDGTHAWVVVSRLDTKFLYRTADAGRSWSRGDSIPTPQQLGELFFLDPQDGWMLTYAAPDYKQIQSGPYSGALMTTGPVAIFRTTDGGLHWRRLGESVIPISGCEWDGISFVSTTTGWMGVNCISFPQKGPMLFVTHDGGVTWHAQSQPVTTWNCRPRVPSFTDNAHGTAIACDATGQHVLLGTSDAGSTWDVRPLPFEKVGLTPPPDSQPGWRGPSPEQVGFSDPMHGWAVLCTAHDLSFYRTDNGGRTWLDLSTNLSQQVGGSCVGISFLDAYVGLAWKQDSGKETQYLFKTADGGVTWKLASATHWRPKFP